MTPGGGCGRSGGSTRRCTTAPTAGRTTPAPRRSPPPWASSLPSRVQRGHSWSSWLLQSSLVGAAATCSKHESSLARTRALSPLSRHNQHSLRCSIHFKAEFHGTQNQPGTLVFLGSTVSSGRASSFSMSDSDARVCMLWRAVRSLPTEAGTRSLRLPSIFLRGSHATVWCWDPRSFTDLVNSCSFKIK